MKEQFRRRRLPHLEKPGAIYFVTSCLDGSLPASGLRRLADYRRTLGERKPPSSMEQSDWNSHKWKLQFARMDELLDQGLAANHLSDVRLAEEVEQSMLHFAGERYAIWAWVVMSNHVHWVFEPLPKWVERLSERANDRTPRERILHSVKRHSARQCNRLLGVTGAFWQDESYDHCVRDPDELRRIIDYVELNPVATGLVSDRESYRFSSAYYRTQNKLPFGRPLLVETQLTAFD